MNIVEHADDRNARPGPIGMHRELLSNRILPWEVASGKGSVYHYNGLGLRRITFGEEASPAYGNAQRLRIFRAGKSKVALWNLVGPKSLLTDDPKATS